MKDALQELHAHVVEPPVKKKLGFTMEPPEKSLITGRRAPGGQQPVDPRPVMRFWCRGGL